MFRLPEVRLLFLCLLLVCTTGLSAQLKIPAVFSNNMVLQRNMLLPVWGKATPGTNVTVSFLSQQKTTVTNKDSNWSVVLEPLLLSTTPADLVIKGETIITFHNVLVGDVWLCTGQSNMEYPLDRAMKKYAKPLTGTDIAAEELTKPDKPNAIRYIYVERTLNKYPQLPTKGWVDGNDTTVRYVSAIGYFFAKEIYEQTNVPIGIISSSWGGTRIEQWTPAFAYNESDIFKQFVSSDTFKIDGMKPEQMYKGMIEPFIPFAIKGVLWYQGESNCMIEDQDTYVEKMRLFENSWRTLFHSAQLPFYTVQISPFLYTGRKDPKKHTDDLLPRFWEAQTNCLKLPATYMIVTTDLVDNLKDIHPSYKWVVAHRLALQVLHNEYQKTEVQSNSPQYKSSSRKKNKLIISLINTGSGLQSSDGQSLNWFSIADAKGEFVPAVAEISGDKIIVYSDRIRKPKYVRFAWSETAMPNLVSKEARPDGSVGRGLPCIPFRTDHF